MIDTRIITFLTLCREMNYRKTAELLHMTQPAVTQHIQYLERQYGCRLVEYDRRQLRLTARGELLRQYGENVVYQERRLRRELAAEQGVHLSVGATRTIGEYVMAPLVDRLLARPGNTLAVDVDNTEQLLQRLCRGELDFALIEGAFDTSRFVSELYRPEPFVGVCAADHPFAHRTVQADELRKQELIVREEGSGTRQILEQLLARHSRSMADFGRVTTVSNLSLLRQLLQRRGAVTFAYEAVARADGLAPFAVAGWETVREFRYVFLDTPPSRSAVEYFHRICGGT